MTTGAKQFYLWAYASSLCLFVALGLGMSGHFHLARVFALITLPGIQGGSLLYILFVDSARRWPQLSWGQRWISVLTWRRSDLA